MTIKLRQGGKYNWKHSPSDKLTYMGTTRYFGDRRTWYQFELVKEPGNPRFRRKLHWNARCSMVNKSFMAKAIADDDGEWVKCTPYHWQRIVAGKLLDYWPGVSKFQYDGKVQIGNVKQFIAKLGG